MKREKYGCIYGTNLKMYIQKLRNILRVSIIIKVHVIQHINARPFATLITRSKPLFSLITIFVYISRFTFIKKFHTRYKRISDNSHSLLRATMRHPKNDTLQCPLPWWDYCRDKRTMPNHHRSLSSSYHQDSSRSVPIMLPHKRSLSSMHELSAIWSVPARYTMWKN